MSSTTLTPATLAKLLTIAREKKMAHNNPTPKPVSECFDEDANRRLKEVKESLELNDNTPVQTVITEFNSYNQTNPNEFTGTDRYGKEITFNEKQSEFIKLPAGESCIIIGAAGTGKTTTVNGKITRLVQSGYAGVMNNITHKYLPQSGTPGIVACAFTRRAVANLRRAMPKGMENNAITIHKLLEYEPVYYEIPDPNTGETRKTMRFEPTRHIYNKLPSSVKVIIIDESSMVSVELFKEIEAAAPDGCMFIFVGDIQQLPPVFGSAILGYKMLELPVVELTEVYRQALESPIIRLAHRILSGKPIPASEYPEWKFPNQLTLHQWKKKLHPDHALPITAKFFTAALESGAYNPEEDMILIPFNVSLGTNELNKYIAQHIAKKQNKLVYEITGGIQKLYLSVGDKVLYDREDAIVLDIKTNPLYFGTPPQPASFTLDYWGNETGNKGHHDEMSDEDVELFLSSVATGDEETVRKSSHKITLKLLDSDREITVDTAGGVQSILLSYALTVHKSQGSEWRKVFLVFHQSHATMIQRELLYTAVTRAREELYVICEAETFTNGILSQKIKGNTLAEKAEFFKGKKEANDGKY